MTERIAYKGGYKYQLVETYTVQVNVFPAEDITTFYIDLTVDGLLIIRRGYAWDGPSGPTIDTDTFMRGSLVHDAGYQLLRAGLLAPEQRLPVDKELRKICLEDGMWRVRAWWVYRGVRRFGGRSTRPAARKPVLYAP